MFIFKLAVNTRFKLAVNAHSKLAVNAYCKLAVNANFSDSRLIKGPLHILSQVAFGFIFI